MVSCLISYASSVKARLTSEKIDRRLKVDKRKWNNEKRILLIGMPNSGKSTFLKQLSDSTKYFLGEVKRLVEPNYMPSDADIAIVKTLTTEVTELEFEYDGGAFRIIRVDALCGNSRKWIHHFEEVYDLIFVASLSEYDEVSVRQSSKTRTRLEDSLELFQTICHYPWLTLTSMILFLNKKDVLAEKILYSHMADYFPDYDGPPCDEVYAREYILRTYVDQNLNSEKIIYSHFTCSIDMMNIRNVFSAVKDYILQLNLPEYNLY